MEYNTITCGWCCPLCATTLTGSCEKKLTNCLDQYTNQYQSSSASAPHLRDINRASENDGLRELIGQRRRVLIVSGNPLNKKDSLLCQQATK